MGMVGFVFIVAIIAMIKTTDSNLNFFFSTGIFVCFVVLSVLTVRFFRNSAMRRSLFQLQLNSNEIDRYLFSDCKAQKERALVGLIAPGQICIVASNDLGQFFTAIGNPDSIHTSQININPNEVNDFNFVIQNNDFYAINENW
ncbi:hypothetical protein RKQ68_18160 (plasmid) [Acinetobacter baumannii]